MEKRGIIPPFPTFHTNMKSMICMKYYITLPKKTSDESLKIVTKHMVCVRFKHAGCNSAVSKSKKSSLTSMFI